MTTMLEKAARAIALSYYSGDYELEVAQAYAEADWRDWVNEARAVLMAVREPDEAMTEAGVDAELPGGQFGEPGFRESSVDESDVPVIWAAMIDAILADGGKLAVPVAYGDSGRG